MDEYMYENYHHYQESHHFSDILLCDSDIEEKIEFQKNLFENNDLKNDKDQILGTNFTCQINEEDKEQQINVLQNEGTWLKTQRNRRRIRKIETNSKIEIRNNFTFSGSKNDTVELNTNFKTLFKKFIRENYDSQKANADDFLLQFEKGVSSFKAFSDLYESNPQIKDLCSKLIKSSKIIKNIMNSRAKFWMRLQMIKYIEALNKNLQSDKCIRWKSIRKQTN